jgi:predicted DCC family thiol-disulfide oxidoreductase YuxK
MASGTESFSSETRDSCTIIYDEECRFCVRSKEEIERLLKTTQAGFVRFIPYQSLEAEQVLGFEYRLGRPDVAYQVGPDGQIERGLEAMLPVLMRLPGGRLITILLSLPGFKFLAHKLYELVARNRYRWFGALR